jgi:hypothetical protein
MNLFSFKKPKTKKIIFRVWDEWIQASNTDPIPASSVIPSWYKELPRFVNKSDVPIKALGRADLKTCSPFREAITYGYLLVTPCEIEVTRMADGTPELYWNPEFPHQVAHARGDVRDINNQGYGMAVPLGCSPYMFAWKPLFGIEVSKGYSVLLTHPLNRHELPFVLTSGIMDSDVWTTAGNAPFFIKEGFTGIVPKGTPIAQVIPIKRDDWESEIGSTDLVANARLMALRDTFFTGYYHRFIRIKKSFK